MSTIRLLIVFLHYVWKICFSQVSPCLSQKMSYGICGVSQPCMLQNWSFLLNQSSATSPLLEWYSPLTWWRKQLQNLCTFHRLNRMPEHKANMFTTVFIVHRPYFQHPETRDFWTQDMAYEWKTYLHPYPLVHDTSVLRVYLMELNNVQPLAINIHHTSVGPSYSLEIVPKI